MSVSPFDLLTSVPVLHRMRHALMRGGLAPDSCIACSWIVAEVARRMGVKAQVLPVRLTLLNPIMTAWADATPEPCEEDWQRVADRGGRMVVVGDDTHAPLPGRWAGHLVAVLNDDLRGQRYMIDLSVDQAARPEKQILIDHPFVVPMLASDYRSFARGHGEVGADLPSGVRALYQARPGNLGYRDSPDWTHREARFSQPVAQLLWALETPGGPLRGLLEGSRDPGPT